MWKTIIYAANYCPCIHESAFTTISLHMTRKGADDAIKEHRLNALRDNKEWWKKSSTFPTLESTIENERWNVSEIEVLN